MHTVSTILDEKGSRKIHTVPPNASVMQAVEAMCAAKVGAVLVCTGTQCAGIFSERDLMTRVILKQRDPVTTKVADVMTADVTAVGPEVTTEEAMAIMTERRCRHLPVIDGGQVVGLVSIGDLVRHESRDQDFEIRTLTDFILGKYPG
jgi:signal-transduction protein with cAMP-binding, CBS, and nucleotidyltransferase domain